MNDGYTTVFETSYFSDGVWLRILGFYAAGIIVVFFGIRSRMPGGKKPIPIWLFCYWTVGWFTINSLTLYWGLKEGRKFTGALAHSQCQVVEGTVQVLHEQSAGGHDEGDRIRIRGKEFTYRYFVETLRYHRTISHGGQLKDGVTARLHYLDTAILKVEIKN